MNIQAHCYILRLVCYYSGLPRDEMSSYLSNNSFPFKMPSLSFSLSPLPFFLQNSMDFLLIIALEAVAGPSVPFPFWTMHHGNSRP